LYCAQDRSNERGPDSAPENTAVLGFDVENNLVVRGQYVKGKPFGEWRAYWPSGPLRMTKNYDIAKSPEKYFTENGLPFRANINFAPVVPSQHTKSRTQEVTPRLAENGNAFLRAPNGAVHACSRSLDANFNSSAIVRAIKSKGLSLGFLAPTSRIFVASTVPIISATGTASFYYFELRLGECTEEKSPYTCSMSTVAVKKVAPLVAGVVQVDQAVESDDSITEELFGISQRALISDPRIACGWLGKTGALGARRIFGSE
jgi:hypothetical protein